MRISIENVFESTPIALYDLTLPIEDRAKNKIVFKRVCDCLRFLGASQGKFSHAKLRGNSKITDKNGKPYAIRHIDYDKYLKENKK
jgi:hypothetical protein